MDGKNILLEEYGIWHSLCGPWWQSADEKQGEARDKKKVAEKECAQNQTAAINW